MQNVEHRLNNFLLQSSQGPGLTEEERTQQGVLLRETQGLRAEVAALRQQRSQGSSANFTRLSVRVDGIREELDNVKVHPVLLYGDSRLQLVEAGVSEARAGLVDISMRGRTYAPRADVPSVFGSGSTVASGVPPGFVPPASLVPVRSVPPVSDQWTSSGGAHSGGVPAPIVRTVENPTPGTNQGGLVPQRQVPAPLVARPELSGFTVTPEGKYLVPGFDSDEQHWFDVLIDSEI